MTPGTQVWAAREGKDGVEVDSARVLRVVGGVAFLHGTPAGHFGRAVDLRILHATRTAALEALAERLEESAREDRRLAAEFIARAEQRLVLAHKALRMAGER